MVTVTAGNLQEGKYGLSIRSALDCETPILGITWDDSSTATSAEPIEGSITKTVTVDFAKAEKNGVDTDEDNTDDIAQIKFCVVVDKIETQNSVDLVVASKAGVATLNYNMAGLGYQIDSVPVLAVTGADANYDAGLSLSLSSSGNDVGVGAGVGGVGGSIERILQNPIDVPTFALVEGGASGDMVTVTVDVDNFLFGIRGDDSSTVTSAETVDLSKEATNIFVTHEDNTDEAPIDFPSEMPIGAPSVSNPPTYESYFTEPPTESRSPSVIPSSTQSSPPSVEAVADPSSTQSSPPQVEANEDPSATPSSPPSVEASEDPSSSPSSPPSIEASADPSATPSSSPSVEANEDLSATPSSTPSAAPSDLPSAKPSDVVCIEEDDFGCNGNTDCCNYDGSERPIICKGVDIGEGQCVFVEGFSTCPTDEGADELVCVDSDGPGKSGTKCQSDCGRKNCYQICSVQCGLNCAAGEDGGNYSNLCSGGLGNCGDNGGAPLLSGCTFWNGPCCKCDCVAFATQCSAG